MFYPVLRFAFGPICGIQAMASQKFLLLDAQNRIVAQQESASDLTSLLNFAIEGKVYDFKINVYRRGENASAREWHNICASKQKNPNFAICNRSDVELHLEPAEFWKLCYSHWHGIPGHSKCSVFGLQYKGNEQFLVEGPTGIIRAEGGKDFRLLGVKDYQKTFMFVDPSLPDDAKEQRSVFTSFCKNLSIHNENGSLTV